MFCVHALCCEEHTSANHPHTAKHPRTKKANPVKSWLFLVLASCKKGGLSPLFFLAQLLSDDVCGYNYSRNARENDYVIRGTVGILIYAAFSRRGSNSQKNAKPLKVAWHSFLGQLI